MADNTVLNSGTGGDTIRDVDRLGIKTQVVTLDLNPGGAEVLMSGGMPVTGTFWQSVQPVSLSGTMVVDSELTTADLDTGAGTDTRAVVGLVYAASGGAATVSAASPLPVSGTVAVSGTIPVSGTFWQATQPVSGTVTANAGTGTFAVSAAALPLPTGAATAARQPALGTAGTPSADVLTVQGAATMTAFKVDGSAVTQPVSGTFWQATQPVSGTVTASQATAGNFNATVVGTGTFAVQAALQAGTALVGQVAAGQQVNQLFSGTTALTPKFAPISASASGATTVVAAVVAKKIRILRWSLVANGPVNVNWQSHATTGTATGTRYMTQFATAGGSYCPVGIFETAVGEALDLNLSAAVAVGGELTYVEV